MPTFTHARDMIEMVPGARVDGAEEIVRAAGQTGAQMHYCHLNSTSQRAPSAARCGCLPAAMARWA